MQVLIETKSINPAVKTAPLGRWALHDKAPRKSLTCVRKLRQWP